MLPLFRFALALSILAAWPAHVEACSCHSVSEFASQAKDSPLLIAGQVVATVTSTEGPSSTRPDNVAALEIDVLDVTRGRETRRRIRVWDQFVNSSCSLELHRLKPGTYVLIAVNSKEERLTELAELIGIKPAPDDYVWVTCRDPWRPFKTVADMRRFIEDGLRLR